MDTEMEILKLKLKIAELELEIERMKNNNTIFIPYYYPIEQPQNPWYVQPTVTICDTDKKTQTYL